MWLTVREPGGPERRVEVGPGSFSVGRGDDCDLVLADLKASRRHALIEGRPDGSFTVRDLASTNGTVVNGRRIAATVDLHDGERITIGGTSLTVAEVDAQRVTLSETARSTRVREAPRPGPPALAGALPEPEAESAPSFFEPAAESAPAVVEPEPESPPAVVEPRGQAPSSGAGPGPRAPAERPPHDAQAARRWSRRTIALASAGGVLALLVLALVAAQFTLPGIAASRLRDSLKQHGAVQSLSVSAFPAVTLLWHEAEKVTVRMRTYTDSSAGTGGGGTVSQLGNGPRRLADFLASTSATDSLDARVGRASVGRLALESVVLTKSGAELNASAFGSYGDIRAALPSFLTIRSFAAGGGELLFTGAASLLGQHANVRMRLVASNGALVVQPVLGPFLPAGLSLTVFKDSRIFVESVSAEPAPGGFDLFARARLT